MRTNAGDLRDRITVQRDSVIRVSGVEKRTIETLLSAWSKAEPIRGGESWRNEQVNADVDWRFTVRYQVGQQLLASDRVVMDLHTYEIKAILPDRTDRDLTVLLCKSTNG
jgi:SPP1 family predicted phage head-tail adaptor